MLNYQIFGIIGAICFSLCCLPQVWRTWRTKSMEGFSWGLLGFWMGGEVAFIIYMICDDIINKTLHLPLHVNYWFNGVMVGYLIWAKWRYL